MTAFSVESEMYLFALSNDDLIALRDGVVGALSARGINESSYKVGYAEGRASAFAEAAESCTTAGKAAFDIITTGGQQ
jgi:hypothetical protein